MSRVLMIGYGPLPDPKRERNSSACLRTRQILLGTLEGGHEVDLVTLPLPGSADDAGGEPSTVPDEVEGCPLLRFTRHDGEYAISVLNERLEATAPDALVAVNTYPAYVASMVMSTLPLWVDLNGLWMAQMQARCFAEMDDSRLAGGWAIERAVLRRLDKFSAVSRPQLHAVLGEMGALGRLNKFTFQYPFGAHVPIALHEGMGAEAPPGPPILRGQRVPEGAFILLWTGGFNLWADIETLIRATDRLMEHYPEVHFVATGGDVEGVDTTTYERFQEVIRTSPHRERYHLLGWIRGEDLRRVYREADVGLNADGPNYETLFGARTRILAMAAEGLPVATSVGTELSEWLDDARAVLSWRMGDADSLVEAIEPWIEQREQLKKYSERALALIREDFTISHTTRALRTWLEAPALAPDNAAKLEEHTSGDLEDLNAATLNTLEAQAVLLDQYDARSLLKSAREMEVLQQQTWYQAYKKAKRWIAD
jgi:glycosyltransferase involved in cell wall biosynthesis